MFFNIMTIYNKKYIMNLNEHISRMKNLFNAEHGLIKPLVSEQKKPHYEHLTTFKSFSEYCTNPATPRDVVGYVEDLEDMGFKCVGSIQLLEPNYPFKPEDYENPEYLEKYTEEQMAADTITLLKPMPLDGGYLYINLHTIKFINPVSTFGYYIEYYSGRQREGNVNGIEGVKKLEQELDAEFRKEK
jgi:hypothetical protein